MLICVVICVTNKLFYPSDEGKNRLGRLSCKLGCFGDATVQYLSVSESQILVGSPAVSGTKCAFCLI